MSMELRGIGITKKLTIGNAHWIRRDEPEIRHIKLNNEQINSEITRYQKALNTAYNHLVTIKEQVCKTSDTNISTFIETHLNILRDDIFTHKTIELIRSYQCNSEWALKMQCKILIGAFSDIEDAYLRARKDDIYQVVSQIQCALNNHHPTEISLNSKQLKNHIIVANDLSPAEMVILIQQDIAGIVTEFGGPLSHTAILARSLDIPAIVGTHHAVSYIRHHETLVLDCDQGVIQVEPNENCLSYYLNKQSQIAFRQQTFSEIKGTPTISKDNQAIELLGNVELNEDIIALDQTDATGIGLYRTEFLFMSLYTPPKEDEQYEHYTKIIKQMNGKPVTIRTLDLGADKKIDGGRIDSPMLMNPALGLRGIRLCLREPQLFKPQLRALYRASIHGQIRIIIPMLSSCNEIKQVLRIIEEVKRELKNQGHPFDPHIPIGGMLEVPAAILMAADFADILDFFSIGTNDLIQYTLAIDRIDDAINYLYDPLHPAVLRLIQMIIDVGKQKGIPISMCGEMAGDSRYTKLLLGMGLRSFSMHPKALMEVKHIIHNTDIKALEKKLKKNFNIKNNSLNIHNLEEINA